MNIINSLFILNKLFSWKEKTYLKYKNDKLQSVCCKANLNYQAFCNATPAILTMNEIANDKVRAKARFRYDWRDTKNKIVAAWRACVSNRSIPTTKEKTFANEAQLVFSIGKRSPLTFFLFPSVEERERKTLRKLVWLSDNFGYYRQRQFSDIKFFCTKKVSQLRKRKK